MRASKPKLSVYWASSCGRCEIAVVNLHEKLLDLDARFELVFCPCLMDTKKEQVESMADGSIAITLFNGAIRTEENEEMARLLRKKSQVLVAYGSCSSMGGIPALSNLHTRDEHFQSIYLQNPTLDNISGVIPQSLTRVPEGTLHLPRFSERVKTLADAVAVDYFMPGCPPEPHQIWKVIELVSSGGPLPPKGSVIGAGNSSVCDECSRVKNNKKIKEFHRTFELAPDADSCLLEQGIFCMGIATRDGCGAPCPKSNMPCIGCYGPCGAESDQGDSIPDAAGTFYKFSVASSILGGRTE